MEQEAQPPTFFLIQSAIAQILWFSIVMSLFSDTVEHWLHWPHLWTLIFSSSVFILAQQATLFSLKKVGLREGEYGEVAKLSRGTIILLIGAVSTLFLDWLYQYIEVWLQYTIMLFPFLSCLKHPILFSLVKKLSIQI